jgi:ligand-binding sensor domain-containing protein
MPNLIALSFTPVYRIPIRWGGGGGPVPEDTKKRSVSLVLILVMIAIVGAVYIVVICDNVQLHDANRTPWQIIRPPHVVEALAIQGDIIWAGGPDGVVGIDRTSGNVTHEIPCKPSPTYVQALLLDGNGSLWIGYGGGIIRYDGRACQYIQKDQGLPDNHVQSMLQDRYGRVWIGTSDGAVVFDGTRWQVITTADGLLDNMVNAMLEDSHGGLWFGSYVAPRGGISYLREGTWQYFSLSNGLPHNDINAFFEDRDGSVWAGTGFYNRGGAARFTFNGSAWSISGTLMASDGLAGEKVRSIFQDSHGSLWFGSEYDGIARLRDGHFRVFSVKDGLSDPEVMCLVQDTEGDLWMGTHDGVTRIPAGALAELG